MRPTPAGIYPFVPPSNASPQGEVLAATQLGAIEDGGNLVAYIVRTKDDSASKRASSTFANVNDPQAKPSDFSANLAAAENVASTSGATSAKFLTPDSLLTPTDRAKVSQLRARDAAIKKEAEQLGSSGPQPSYVYQPGPDGRNYIVGVATPLVLQNMPGDVENNASPTLSGQEQDAALAAYNQRAGSSPTPLRAGFINSVF